MAKNNIRSFRYSDEVAKHLEKQPENSLNEKFENLVISCCIALPEVLKQTKEAENQLLLSKQKLWDVIKQVQQLQDYQSTLKQAEYYINNLGQKAKQLHDNVTQ